MDSCVISILSNRNSSCTPKVATYGESQIIANKIKKFFNGDYVLPTFELNTPNLFPIFRSENMSHNENVQEIDSSDDSDSETSNPSSKNSKILSKLNEAFHNQSISIFLKCIHHFNFYLKKTTPEIKTTINHILSTISSGHHHPGFFPDFTDVTISIPMKYKKLSSTTAFAVSQSQLFLGKVTPNAAQKNTAFGEVSVFSLDFSKQPLSINDEALTFTAFQQTAPKTFNFTILFPCIQHLKNHENFSIVYLKNLVYQIFSSTVRVKQLSKTNPYGFSTFDDFYEFRKHELLRFPAVTDGNKIYSYDNKKKVLNIFVVDPTKPAYLNTIKKDTSNRDKEYAVDVTDESFYLIPQFERSVFLAHPILHYDPVNTLMATDGSVITFGSYNNSKKDNIESSSDEEQASSHKERKSSRLITSTKSGTIKYHFYLFSLQTGKLIKKFTKTSDSIIDAWAFNPYKITNYILERKHLKVLKGVAAIPRWLEGLPAPVSEKKSSHPVIDALQLAVFDGSTFFYEGNLSLYEKLYIHVFNSGNMPFLKAISNLFISYSPKVDDVINLLNEQGWEKANLYNIGELLFFTFLSIIPRSTKKISENNYASKFIENSQDLKIIFVFSSLFDFQKLPLTPKAIDQLIHFIFENEIEFPYETTEIMTNYCNVYAVEHLNEKGYKNIKKTVESIFRTVPEYIDQIRNKKHPAQYFKTTLTYRFCLFFIHAIAHMKTLWVYFADSFIKMLEFSFMRYDKDMRDFMFFSLSLYLELFTMLPHRKQSFYFANLNEFYVGFPNPLNGFDPELDKELFQLLNSAFNLSPEQFANCFFRSRQILLFENDSNVKVKDYVKTIGIFTYLIIDDIHILLPLNSEKYTDQFFALFHEHSKKLSKQQLVIFSFYSDRLVDLIFSYNKNIDNFINDFSSVIDLTMITQKMIQHHEITLQMADLLNSEGSILEAKLDVLIELKRNIKHKNMIFEIIKQNSLVPNSTKINYINLSEVKQQPYHYTLWTIFYLVIKTSVTKFNRSMSMVTESEKDVEKKASRGSSSNALEPAHKYDLIININEFFEIFKAHILCGNPDIIRMIMKSIVVIEQNEITKKCSVKRIFVFLLKILKQYFAEKSNPFLLQEKPADVIDSIFIIIQYMKELFNSSSNHFRSFLTKTVKSITDWEEAISIFAILNNSFDVIRPGVVVHYLNESLEQVSGLVVAHSQIDATAKIRVDCENTTKKIYDLNYQAPHYKDIAVNLSKFRNVWVETPTTACLQLIEDVTPFVSLFFNHKLKPEDETDEYVYNTFRLASIWDFTQSNASFYASLTDEQKATIIHRKEFPLIFKPEQYFFNFGFYTSLRFLSFPPFSFVDVANSKNGISRSPIVNNLVMNAKPKNVELMTTLFESTTFVSPPIHPSHKMRITFYLYPKAKNENSITGKDFKITVYGLALPYNCVFQSDSFEFDSDPAKLTKIVVSYHPTHYYFKIYENGQVKNLAMGSPSIALFFLTIELASNSIAEYHVNHNNKQDDIILTKSFGFNVEIGDKAEEDNDDINLNDQNEIQNILMKITDRKVYTQMNDSSIYNSLCLRDASIGLIESFKTLITIHHLKNSNEYFPFSILHLLASIDPYPVSSTFSLDNFEPAPQWKQSSIYIYDFLMRSIKLHKDHIISTLNKEIQEMFEYDCQKVKKGLHKNSDGFDSNNIFTFNPSNKHVLFIRPHQQIPISNCYIFSLDPRRPLKIIGYLNDLTVSFTHAGIVVPFYLTAGSILDYLLHMKHIMNISLYLNHFDFSFLEDMILTLESTSRYFPPLFAQFSIILNLLSQKTPQPNCFPVNFNPFSFLIPISTVHNKPEVFLLTSYCEHFGNKTEFQLNKDNKSITISSPYVRLHEKKYRLYISIHDENDSDDHHLEFTINGKQILKLNEYLISEYKSSKKISIEYVSENLNDEIRTLTVVTWKVPKIDKITSELKKWKPHHSHQLLAFSYAFQASPKHHIPIEVNLVKHMKERYNQIPLSTEFSFKTALFVIYITDVIRKIVESHETKRMCFVYNGIKELPKDDIADSSDDDDGDDNPKFIRKSTFILEDDAKRTIGVFRHPKLFIYYFHLILDNSSKLSIIKKTQNDDMLGLSDSFMSPFDYFKRICDRSYRSHERVEFLKDKQLTISTLLDPDAIRVNLECHLYPSYEAEFHSRLKPNTLIKFIHNQKAAYDGHIKKLLKFLRKAPAIVLLQFVEFCTGLWGTKWLLNNRKDAKMAKTERKSIITPYKKNFNKYKYQDNQQSTDDYSSMRIFVFFSEKPNEIDHFQIANLLVLGQFQHKEEMIHSLLKKLQEYSDNQLGGASNL